MRTLAGALAVVLMAGPAFAHPPPLGIGGFPGGLLHPLFVPAHLMAIAALGLLIGQQAAWTRLVTFGFIVGLSGGLGAMMLGLVPIWMNELVLALALMAGLLVALARPVPEVVGCILAVLIGLCLALDAPPETVSLSEANQMLAGTGLGAALLLVAVAEATRRLKPHWTKIGVRVLGSWIAASAILVLVMRLAR